MLTDVFDLFADALARIYAIWPSYGVAIVVLTLMVMVVLTPVTLRQARSMAALQRLAPEVRQLQATHKGDRERLQRETAELYRHHQVSPLAGCLPMAVQMPAFFVLYRVIRGLTFVDADGSLAPKYVDHSTALYRALHEAGGQMVSWGMDLSRSALAPHHSVATAAPFYLLVAGIVATSAWQQRVIAVRTAPGVEKGPQQQMIGRVMPAVMGVIALSLPAGVGIYYLVSNLARVGQQKLARRNLGDVHEMVGEPGATPTAQPRPAGSAG